MQRQEFWMTGNRRAVIYEDGEIYVDGQRYGKLYSDGEIYIDGVKRGKLYSDGELYIDGEIVGKLYSDGEFWADGQKIGKVYNTEEVYESTQPSYENASLNSTVYSGNSMDGIHAGESVNGVLAVIIGFLIALFLIGLFIMASYKMWAYMFWENLQDYSDTPIRMVAAGILIVVIQFSALVLQIKRILSEKAGWGIKTGFLYHTLAGLLHMTLDLLILDGMPTDIVSMVLPMILVCFVIGLVPTAVGCLIGNVLRFIRKKRRNN